MNYDPVVKRGLSQANCQRMKTDFAFLFKMSEKRCGELDIALRENYFNVYYRGNSLAKVKFLPNELYQITISNTFYRDSTASIDKDFPQATTGKPTTVFPLKKKLLHRFFQVKHLDNFCSRIKKESNSGEEIILEQSVITDNRERQDFLIIDRQVEASGWNGRIDLLALKRNGSDEFHFVILEVKLGNNKELEGLVGEQLERYVNHVEQNFDDYKKCYEEVYRQRKELGLHQKPVDENITIVKPVEGEVIVLGYSGLAEEKLVTLRANYPDLKIRQFHHQI